MSNYAVASRAVFWSGIDLLLRNGINVFVLIILARLLDPSDFGLMAIIAIFVGIGSLLIDSGFNQAIIQRDKVSHADESTIFFFTIVLGVFVAALLALSASYIADFYHQPILRNIVLLMSLNLTIQSFGAIHISVLSKALNFKTQAKVNVAASISGGICAVIMAALGFGVWSLVSQAIIYSVVMVVALWIFHPWRPILVFKVSTLKSYFGFGGYVLWFGLLSTIYKNLYALLIGKLHSVESAGYYDQSRRIQQLPIDILVSVVNRVAFPLYSSAKDNKPRLQLMVAKSIKGVMFFTLPLMIGLMLLAEPLIGVVLGEKWLPMAPVLAALAISGLATPLNQMNVNLLKARGLVALNARIQLVRLAIGISLLLLTSPYGIVAVAYGQAATSWLSFFLNTYYTGVHLEYGWLKQLREVSPCLMVSILMAAAIKGVGLMYISHGLLELTISVLVGAVVYLTLCRLFRLEALTMAVDLVRSR